MIISYNRVILIGNLTRNPEIRYTSSGRAVMEMSMAINENFKNKTGETFVQTCFVDVVVWGHQAEETSAKYLRKAASVLVEGKLQFDQRVNRQGEKRSRLCVRANRVLFMSAAPDKDSGSKPSKMQPNTLEEILETPSQADAQTEEDGDTPAK